MMFTQLRNSQPKEPESSQVDHGQKIINGVLKISLESSFLKEQLTKILKYLLSYPELRLAEKGAIFLAHPELNELQLQASIGFSEYQISTCKKVEFGKCQCGKSAKERRLLYFPYPPPFLEGKEDNGEVTGQYCIPISLDEQITGLLLICAGTNHIYNKRIETLFESVANIISAVIENEKKDHQMVELVNSLRSSIVNQREEKFFSESIIESLNHGLIVTDLSGNILKINSAAGEILEPFRLSPEGKNIKELFGKRHGNLMETVLSGSTVGSENEITLKTMDGEQKILNYSTGPRQDSQGNHVGIILSFTDVTELRYAQKELEKMNRLSTVAEIASAVAHEVRNPLAGIKIMAQSIEEDSGENEQHLECSQRIIRQVDRLNELLGEFFSYARPVEPKKRPTPLPDILAETLPLINNKLSQCKINYTQHIAPDLPPIIADPNQMQQVFLNLLLNAIDAIKQSGSITVAAMLLTGENLRRFKTKYPTLIGDDRCVLVRFSDNGAGMEKEIAEKVFEPFVTTKPTGTGLGLSIVYRTLLENGANITLTSSPGKGAIFDMFFQTDR